MGPARVGARQARREHLRCNDTAEGTCRDGRTNTIHPPGLSNSVLNPPECCEPHGAVGPLFTQHGPQAAPQCSYPVQSHYTQSCLCQIQIFEAQSASTSDRAVMNNFGLHGFAGGDDKYRLSRPSCESGKRVA